MLELLLFNCLNFNETKISHNFGGGYHFVVKFAFSFLGGGGGGWAYMSAFILSNTLNEIARLDTFTTKHGFNMLFY